MLVVSAAVGFLLWYTLVRGAHEIQPLVPALKSWWMKLHVPANFIGYGTFALSAMVAFAYLIKQQAGETRWYKLAPLWLLGVFWPLCLGHLLLELFHAYAWLWLVDLPLLVLTATLLWRWWPRGPKPGLLAVLFLGLAWLPLAFWLYATQSIAYAMTGVYWLGRGPAHALFVGFFGSVLIAMVTRVTQGHSGRPLRMPAVAWFAFIAIQVVAVMRVAAEILPDAGAWQALAALGWLLAFLPWLLRIGRLYLGPRADGKPG
jgi:uncharacterized protein involved in response to NO